jgi:amino acid permease
MDVPIWHGKLTFPFSRLDGLLTKYERTIGQNVDPVVWISLFLVLVIIINMFPVKVCSMEWLFVESDR